MSMNRKLLATYVSLNTPKADSYLAKVASEIRDDTASATNNDDMFEGLETLKEFVYRVPEPTIETIRLAMASNFPARTIETQFGPYEGKSREDVLALCIELLSQIRYIYPDGALPLLAQFIRGEEGELREKASTALKHFAKYDFNVLTKTKLGYGPQRKALDFVLAWSDEAQLANVQFVAAVAESLLDSSIEGTTADSIDTVKCQFGAVQPTEFVKRLRRETIDLIAKLFHQAVDPRTRLRLVKIMEGALHTPTNVVYGDDLAQMISDDGKYLVGVFRSILFKDDGSLGTELAIALEVDKILHWFQRREKLRTVEAEQLRNDLLAHPFYSLARVFVGEDLMFLEESEWSEAERKRSETIARLIGEVTEGSAHSWYETLNSVAGELGVIDDWQFRRFHEFLRKLAAGKPEIAAEILQDSLPGRPLAKFATSVLAGFRDAARVDLWDAVVDHIVTLRDVSLVGSICYSISFGPETEQRDLIRERDLLLLEDIVRRRGRFAFLSSEETSAEPVHFAVRSAILANFKRDSHRLEPLLFEEAAKNSRHRDLLIRELGFAAHRKWIDIAHLGVVPPAVELA